MYRSQRFIITVALLGAYLLSACTGALPQQDDSPAGSQSTEVVFTGTVEAMDGTQWLISGQQVDVEGSSIDANIQVGDIVRVEANVSGDGSVLAVKIESSGSDDTGANDNSANDNSGNANDDNANSNDANSNDDNSNDNGNANDNGNDNSNTSGTEQEVSGVVQAIGTGTITIDGVTYNLTDSTEFKDAIAVGDQVKIHVIANADGTLTIREIERVGGTSIGNDNGNSNDDDSNANSNDDNSNDDDSNGNSNDDNSNGGDDNSNGGDGGNSNDDDSNSNGNG